MGFWRVTVFLISLTYQGKAEEVRCYCNLDECLPNNSTCFRENGGCFSNFLDYPNISHVEYGCLHLLKRERQEQCGNIPGSPTLSTRSLLLCCKGNMCNQMLGPMPLFTYPIIGSLMNATEGQNNLMSNLDGFGNYDQQTYKTNEVWFKAATIAVPICGAMILFLLVALAFRMLRADHAGVDKYSGKGKSNANSSDAHVIGFKGSQLNSEDLSKKIPLLYEMRHNERSENFRSFTSARIHFGQNVNILRDEEDLNRVEKNLENAKINLEKPSSRPKEGPTTSNGQSDESNNNSISKENNSNSTLDVRVESEEICVLPVLSLNLDKPESLSSCNIYKSPRTYGQSTFSVNLQDKIYDKYLL